MWLHHLPDPLPILLDNPLVPSPSLGHQIARLGVSLSDHEPFRIVRVQHYLRGNSTSLACHPHLDTAYLNAGVYFLSR